LRDPTSHREFSSIRKTGDEQTGDDVFEAVWYLKRATTAVDDEKP